MLAAMGIKEITSASVKLQRRLTSLEHVKGIHFTFDAFDPLMKGQREFHRRCMGKKLLATNPKCEITYKQMEDMAPPTTTMTFNDGHKIEIMTAGMQYQDITEQLNGYVMTLALKEIFAEGEKYAKDSQK